MSNEKVIVLVTRGSHEFVDYVFIMLFDTYEKANSYCLQMSTGKVKHWCKAEIVDECVPIVLEQPE